jgi:nucleotide-binding universal stress UspA family protein
MADTKLLVVLDDSVASRRALKYVGKFVGRRKGFRICLLHVLPPLPADLLEHGGAENPSEEAQLGTDQKNEQHRWISAAKQASQKGLDGARAILQTAGIPAGTVKALSYEPGENQDAADVILEIARGSHCRTIVVGRQSVSWFQKLFSEQLADELHRRSKELSVWAIE